MAACAEQGQGKQNGKAELHVRRFLRKFAGPVEVAFIGSPFYGCKRTLTWLSKC
jgi:hypothetical protein